MSSLFAQATPGGTITAGTGNNGTNGLHFTVSSAATLAGVWHWSSASDTQLPASIGLYTTQAAPASGTLVTSNTATWLTGPGGSAASAGSGWCFAAFTSPPSLTAGVNYMATQFRNDATNRWFSFYSVTWPVTSGVITAPKDESTSALSQGWYNIGTAMAMPLTQSGTAGDNFGMDVEVTTGTSRTATASLTVTPSFTAAGQRTRNRSASLTVTPSLSATAAKGPPTHTATASLTVTPSFTAARQASHVRTASLTVTPAFTAVRQASHVRTASLTVTPSFSAAGAAARHRTAALTVTPVLTAAASKVAGAPPGYPDGDLGAITELYLGTTWTDITTAALPDGMEYATVKSATPDGAQQPNPASMAAIWDNPDYRFSPRNTAGPYYGQLRQNTAARVSVTSPYGAYLRLEAGSSDRAFVSDTAALRVTGSLELRIGARLSDWRGCILAARWDNSLPSWWWSANRDGTFTFTWVDSGGTQHAVTSPTAAKVSWAAYRVTLDAANGNAQFYVSTDIDGTWTSMGAAASGTAGAATTVRAGNAPLVVGYSFNGVVPLVQMSGQVFGFRLYNGIGGSVVADAAFSRQVPGSASWTDLAGLAWSTAGGAELSDRDYRLHGELSSLAPTAASSGGMARVQASVGGRLRRMQQGSAPVVESPLRRAIRTQPGSLAPVIYWGMEDGGISTAFGPVIGGNLMSWTGTPKLAADTTFEASAALPVLNGAVLSAAVPAYTGASAWAVRFPLKLGSTVPAGAEIARVNVTGGACAVVKLLAAAPSGMQLVGLNGGGGTVFDTGVLSWPTILNGLWVSIEATPSGGNTLFAVVTIAPGATIGLSGPTTVSGTYGTVTSVAFNTGGLLTDTVIGHVQVQKAWISMFTLGAPLNAWRTELSADRFTRVCAEQGITCRLLGRATVTQAMGPQPRGSAWQILRDAAAAEQGIIFEPHQSCLGLAFRTREAMQAQNPAVTLSFAAANLRGDLQPVDDDLNFCNDLTAAMPDGTSYRVTLDDGSAKSVSEPPAGAGRYAATTPLPLNLADASQLAGNAAFWLARSSADAARYRNVVADFGIPGAPVADIAKLRPGDLIVITGVPAVYQSADIHQLAMGATETLGPGRRITWDCVPSSPYGV